MRSLLALPLLAFTACAAHVGTDIGPHGRHSEPMVASNGEVVVRAGKIEAQTIRARTIYAEAVEANGGSIGKTFFDEVGRDWGEDVLNVDVVEADVIYAKELKADWIEAAEVHAKEIKIGR